MSAPVFLHDDLAAALDGARLPAQVTLTGPEGRHAATVRRLTASEPVELVDGRGLRASGVVVSAADERLVVSVRVAGLEPPPLLRLVLVQALAKGERGEYAVELATEVGVDEVLPWSAHRCIVRWDGARGERALRRWRATAREAGKQSRRARHPVISEPVTTDGLLARAAQARALVLHEGAAEPLATTPLPAAGELLLVVGPEGGLTDPELAALTGAGASAVRLGPSVLRTSSAGAVAAAVVSARTARWA